MKILLFDIETAPCVSHIWGLWQELKSTKMIIKDWYVLCWCAKWIDGSKIFSSALPDHKSYKHHPECDKAVMQDLWDLLDEADMAIAHNGIKFDRRKVNARFIINNIPPPSPYKMIDTLRIARSQFAFTSNRLDDLGRYLGVGKKVDTGGFNLWIECMQGDKKSWKKMVDYCANDVRLLERVYLKLRPYMPNHPSVALDSTNDVLCCNKCGSKNIIKRGFTYATMGKYQRYQCNECGGWCKDGINLFSKLDKRTKARNIV